MPSEWDYVELASRIFSSSRDEVLAGAGEDDCAVVRLGERLAVFTADSLHEKADFPPQMREWEKGYMSLAVNLSDIAAMGAEPAYFLYTITLVENHPMEKFEEFCRGVLKLAEKYGVDVIGGDTDRGDEFSVSGFAVGFSGRVLLRRCAEVGDRVFLTGITGKAQLSLEQLFSGLSREEIAFPEKLYTPEPRVREGLRISRYAKACTDVSDSLAISLHQIAKASGVRIELKSVDLSELEEFVDSKKALELFLYAGGDYELVYTCDDDAGIEIGRVVEGEGVYLNGRKVEFRGYTH